MLNPPDALDWYEDDDLDEDDLPDGTPDYE